MARRNDEKFFLVWLSSQMEFFGVENMLDRRLPLPMSLAISRSN